MKPWQTKFIAILLITLAISLVLVWEIYLEDMVDSQPVYATIKEIPKGQIVKESDFKRLSVKSEMVPNSYVKILKTVVNKVTTIEIKKGVIIVDTFFDSQEIVPQENQLIVPIPSQWIFSIPGSLRRRDIVTVYDYLPKLGDRNSITSFKVPDEALLKDIPVAYAKDSTNQEVKPSNTNMQRIDATGNISQLELVMTIAQFEKLKNRVAEGYKLIFTYR